MGVGGGGGGGVDEANLVMTSPTAAADQAELRRV